LIYPVTKNASVKASFIKNAFTYNIMQHKLRYQDPP